MYFFIIVIIFLLSIKYKVKKKSFAELKGEEGEKKVRYMLGRLPKEYVLMNNLLIKYKDRTAQIDHILICNKGIFVIETKNYGGKIYGEINKKYWIEKVNGKKYYFYNPVWQNRTHVNAVKKILQDFRNVPIYSVVVFCGECSIKKVKRCNEVIYIRKLNKYIKRYKAEASITKEEINSIFENLNKRNISSKRKKVQHIEYIRKKIK